MSLNHRSSIRSREPATLWRANAPFVIATAAFEGWDEDYLNRYTTRRSVIDAQHAVADPMSYPEFAGNVKTMEARGYWRDKLVSPIPSGNQGCHYRWNAETFMLVGDAPGRGMIDFLPGQGARQIVRRQRDHAFGSGRRDDSRSSQRPWRRADLRAVRRYGPGPRRKQPGDRAHRRLERLVHVHDRRRHH